MLALEGSSESRGYEFLLLARMDLLLAFLGLAFTSTGTR